MKNIIFKITAVIVLITTVSCQDVVEVDLETSKERLVIEALIQWEKGTVGSEQTIKLTKTASFYKNEIVYAVGANVKVTNASNYYVSFDKANMKDVSTYRAVIDGTATVSVEIALSTTEADAPTILSATSCFF